ncbi:MAG: hypothetical protein ABSH56_06400 [Bryobacteraceae bacterium]
MPSIEGLYLRCPVWVQELACDAHGRQLRNLRYGGNYSRILADAEQRSTWPQERIEEFRDRRLRAFILHAVETVPFYRRRFLELGIDAREIRTLADIVRLPVLEKAEVQDQTQAFVSEGVPASAQIVAHTSGTTGAGLRFRVTKEAVREQWAVWWRYRRWHGLHFGLKCGTFAGRSIVPLSQTQAPFWRTSKPLCQILFSGYHMSPANMAAYVEALRRNRPPWLHGYPSLLALLAAYIHEKRLELGYQLQWVTVGAENLLEQQASIIHRAFGVQPKQHYGMAEAVANFSECERGQLHVDEDFAAVEFLARGDGSTYRVVGTNFSNPAMPLIRYDVGDVVSLSDSPCLCGRPGRIVHSVDGRNEDYIVLRDGAKIGRLDHIFKDLTDIREAQILQRRIGEVTLRVVRGPHYTRDDERRLLLATRQRLGTTVDVQIEYFEELPRSSTGKLRFVISDLEEGKLEVVKSE